MTNVTDRNVLQRIKSGDPVVLSGNFSMLAMCMCRICNKPKRREQNESIVTDNLNGAKHTFHKKLIVTVACRATLSLSATVVSSRD